MESVLIMEQEFNPTDPSIKLIWSDLGNMVSEVQGLQKAYKGPPITPTTKSWDRTPPEYESDLITGHWAAIGIRIVELERVLEGGHRDLKAEIDEMKRHATSLIGLQRCFAPMLTCRETIVVMRRLTRNLEAFENGLKRLKQGYLSLAAEKLLDPERVRLDLEYVQARLDAIESLLDRTGVEFRGVKTTDSFSNDVKHLEIRIEGARELKRDIETNHEILVALNIRNLENLNHDLMNLVENLQADLKIIKSGKSPNFNNLSEDFWRWDRAECETRLTKLRKEGGVNKSEVYKAEVQKAKNNIKEARSVWHEINPGLLSRLFRR